MDYEALRRDWSWDRERAAVVGDAGAVGLNMARVAVDRHADSRGDAVAFIAYSLTGERSEHTYREISALSNRFANCLSGLGVGQGDRVFTLMGRQLELYVTALGTLKTGALLSPLFSSFGPEPVRARMELGGARVLITTPQLYRRKVEIVRESLPDLEHVILVDGGGGDEPIATIDFAALMAAADDDFEIAPTDPQAPALLHFTSGTTGAPKAALHVHEAIVAHHTTARLALDLGPGDVYWCTADPGWVTGISYGLLAPLSVGATLVIDQREFDAENWYAILEREQVAVWYTAPTAIRMLRRLGTEIAARHSYPRLRHLASVGEPLEAASVEWGRRALGTPFHDTWWQTETGAIMIANLPGTPVRPGSMGRPMPGIDAAPVRRTEDGVEIVDDPGEPGELALRIGWPSMFRDYIGDPERYRMSFADGWYLSGDLVRRDGDGYFWFVGRADDAIQSAGHLIGPFEVEKTMREHPAVADVAVIGRPDPIAFEVVTAAIVTAPGFEGSEELRRDLIGHARRRLGPAVAPRQITFLPELPRTPSGKVRRSQLRQEAAGAD